jgi:hypothetical protein
MSTQVSRLAFDLLVGLLVAGGVAPLVIVYLPDARRVWVIWTIAVVCVAGTSIIRRLAAGHATTGTTQGRG